MRNILLVLAGIAAVTVGALALYQWQGRTPAPPPQATGPVTDAEARTRALEVGPDDMVLGNPDAPVTVIEYASLTCPACRTFHVDVLPAIKTSYIDAGTVRLVMRDFPLDQGALAAAMLARCAGPERRYAFLDLFFQRQNAWAGAPDPFAGLARVAGIGGMGEADVGACFQNEDVQRAVLEQRLDGERGLGVNSTPSFIIDGNKYAGVMSFEEFKAVVDPLIAKGR